MCEQFRQNSLALVGSYAAKVSLVVEESMGATAGYWTSLWLWKRGRSRYCHLHWFRVAKAPDISKSPSKKQHLAKQANFSDGLLLGALMLAIQYFRFTVAVILKLN